MNRPRLLFSLVLLLLSPAALADADLSVRIGVVGTPFYAQPNDLTVDVTNHGPDAASTVVVTLAAGDPPLVESSDTRCAQTATGIRCEVATLAANQTVQFTARHTFRGNVGTGPRLEANAASATPDPNPSNNTDVRIFIPVLPAAEVVATIYMPAAFNDDGTLTIRYDIRNQHEEFPGTLLAQIGIPRATELVRTNADCRSTGGTGVNLECTLPMPASTTFPLEVTVRLPETAGMVRTSLTIYWVGHPDVAHHSETSNTYIRKLIVTSSADSGPGSLRAVIAEANERCVDFTQCWIHFAIAEPVPVDGWYTIRPLTPLPPVTAPITSIDAKTQTAFGGNTNPLGPEVFLDGSALAGSGNGFYLRGQSASVSGFAISNFPENAIFGIPLDRFAFAFGISHNYIGLDPTGTRAMPNNRGIMIGAGHGSINDNVIGGNVYSGVFLWNIRSLRVVDNRIGVAAATDDPIPNGASGVFVGGSTEGWFSDVDLFRNVIANNGHFGISYPRNVWASVGVNRIEKNALGGVDIDLDGPSPNPGVPMPHISRAFWDGTATVIEGTTAARTTGSVSESYEVLLYANSELEPGRYAEGETHLATVGADATGRFTIRYNGDIRGSYVNGMTVATTNFYSEFFQTRTSEFGQAVLVTDGR